VFVGSHDNGAVCSDDGGVNWAQRGGPPQGDAITIAFAPSDPNRAYALGNGPVLHRSSNARDATSCYAVAWTRIEGGGVPKYWQRNVIAVHPLNADKVYFITGIISGAVGVSTDGGQSITWRQTPGNYVPTCIFVTSDGGGDTIYIGTEGHGAYSSGDDGQSWQAWGLNTDPPEVITAIKRSSGSSPTWWMATTSGLYRKLSGAEWQLNLLFSRYVMSDVAVDPNPDRQGCVYVSYGFLVKRQYHRGGIDFTSNNGGNWNSLTAGIGLHQTPISDVEVDAGDSHWVYATSYGRGFWAHDWGGDMPACTQ
jgi:hypothetical protein